MSDPLFSTDSSTDPDGSQAEWTVEQSRRAQQILRALVSEQDQLLLAAGVTHNNHRIKALELSNSKTDMELATAIACKYERPPEWDGLPPGCEFRP